MLLVGLERQSGAVGISSSSSSSKVAGRVLAGRGSGGSARYFIAAMISAVFRPFLSVAGVGRRSAVIEQLR